MFAANEKAAITFLAAGHDRAVRELSGFNPLDVFWRRLLAVTVDIMLRLAARFASERWKLHKPVSRWFVAPRRRVLHSLVLLMLRLAETLNHVAARKACTTTGEQLT